MTLALQDLPFSPATLRGLSERLIQSHHQNNYAGAVRRLLAIREQLATLDWPKTPGFVLNGLMREQLIAANSMTLHELYFGCLGGDGVLAPGGKAAGLRDAGIGAHYLRGGIEAWNTSGLPVKPK
ncbi:MAG: hypothetical protein ACREVQ_02410 [Burkholderiales bacterium]